MSKRQREVLRAARSRDQARAAEARETAMARMAAAQADVQVLQARHAGASAPPAVGVVTRVDREARRRHHVAQLVIDLTQAEARLAAARDALAEAEAAFTDRVRDRQAVDVLDARAAEAARRQAARRSQTAAEARNARTQRTDDDALQ